MKRTTSVVSRWAAAILLPMLINLGSARGADRPEARGKEARATPPAGAARPAGSDVLVGEDGGVLVVGVFRGKVDFDPGPATDRRSSAGGFDVFVTKYGPAGEYLWTRTWGGPSDDQADGLEVAKSGKITVAVRSSSPERS